VPSGPAHTVSARLSVLAALAAAAVALAAPSVAKADTIEFTVQSGCAAQTFMVPAGVTSVTVEAYGAQGGAGGAGAVPGSGGPGALGGSATATLSVTPGESLQINVGGKGDDATTSSPTGSCNGGGPGGVPASINAPGGGSGGGASDVRQGGTALANRVVVAGGGGGGGGGGGIEFVGGGGGAGGGTDGASGSNGVTAGASSGFAGGGATQLTFGTGGSLNGSPGQLGLGGAGGTFEFMGSSGDGGGGGGAGLYGGGGGGAAFGFGAGGGGGGSGLVPGGGTLIQGVRAGNGLVRITYQPTAVTFSSSAAKRVRAGVVVRWRTASEANTLGFHVYRQVEQRRVRLSHRLIASLGAVHGRTYSFLDRKAPKRGELRYWLQEVALDGSRTWHGPIRARPR
jgi:hypothetical protein